MVKKRKTKKQVGRPTKLTPEIRENFITNLKAGEYIETACTLAGISKPTYYSWIKKLMNHLDQLNTQNFEMK